jgi:hypothetical protein
VTAGSELLLYGVPGIKSLREIQFQPGVKAAGRGPRAFLIAYIKIT